MLLHLCRQNSLCLFFDHEVIIMLQFKKGKLIIYHPRYTPTLAKVILRNSHYGRRYLNRKRIAFTFREPPRRDNPFEIAAFLRLQRRRKERCLQIHTLKC